MSTVSVETDPPIIGFTAPLAEILFYIQPRGDVVIAGCSVTGRALAEHVRAPYSPPSCGIFSIVNPHLNDEPARSSPYRTKYPAQRQRPVDVTDLISLKSLALLTPT